RGLKARAVVEEPLAFTELHLTFENPSDRVIEGRFQIEMPPGAAISRFAMKIGNRWQEGEVVERQAARRAYEDFLHRKQDPALLEHEAGNQFSARVFPIPARARKELILSYSQELADSSEPYRLELLGLPQLDNLDAQVIIKELATTQGGTSLGGTAKHQRVIELRKQNFMPDRDLVVNSQKPDTAMGLRHQNLAVARIAPVANLPADPITGGLTILFDTSASRALGFEREVRELGALVSQIAKVSPNVELRVVCFDMGLQEVYQGPVSGFGQPQLDQIFTRRALGASDLGQALLGLTRAGVLGQRLVVMSDGVATAGEVEAGKLAVAAAGLRAAGVRRIDAIVDGGIKNTELLQQLTRADIERVGAVIDGRLPTAVVADKLSRATLSGVTVSVPGSEWVWPQTLDGIQTGDEVLVYADLPPGKQMVVELAGADIPSTAVPMVEVAKPLLERAWVSARIKRLLAQREELPDKDKDMREALKNQVITLSTRHRVLSPFTALLVLETEWDYRRFNIDRNALVDILTVGADGISVVARNIPGQEPWVATQPIVPQPTTIARRERSRGDLEDEKGAVPTPDESAPRGAPGMTGGAPPPAPAADFESAPAGALEMEESDDAMAFDGFAEKKTEAPKRKAKTSARPVDKPTVPVTEGKKDTQVTASVVFGTIQVSGNLDRSSARRAIRRRLNAVKTCYRTALSQNASLEGTATLEIKVGPDGATKEVKLKQSSGNTTLDQCIIKGFRRVKFDAAEGDSTITVPVTLRPRSASPMRADVAPRLPTRPRRIEPPTPQAVVPPPIPAPPQKIVAPSLPLQPAQDARWSTTPDPKSPYEGKYLAIMQKLAGGDTQTGLAMALEWRQGQPGDVLALLALGEALVRSGDTATAIRAYGSLIDLFPSRADIRRYAGARLEMLGEAGLRAAADTYKKARESRPDHPSSHRMYAFTLVRLGELETAFNALHEGAKRSYPSGRFRGVDQILREDLGIVASAWVAKEPQRDAEIRKRLSEVGASMATQPSLRFILNWETDANDVDFHIRDGQGGHAWYSNKTLPSGGSLYADVTTGYGPECFAIIGKPAAYPYTLQAHYYSRGPMGYGMGKLQVLEHDGQAGLWFEDRPFLIMKDRAYVDLGTVKGPIGQK
ncbi:MAG: TonB family protein, partial [Nannocystaceae bacterium]